MKILIELPDDWLDASNMESLTFITQTVRQEVRSRIVQALADSVKLPELNFSEDEIRPLVLQRVVGDVVAKVTEKPL